MILKVKRLYPDAIVPVRATPGSVGFDLYAHTVTWLSDHRVLQVCTGIAVEFPPGYWLDVRARSSVFKKGLILANGVGTCDSDYRGEIILNFYCAFHATLGQVDTASELVWDRSKSAYAYKADTLVTAGERIGQIILIKSELDGIEEVAELSETVRGVGGFGSTNS